MNKLKYFVPLLIFSFMLSGCAKQEAETVPNQYSTPLLIEATKEGTDSKLYLFGSIHAADETLYPLPDYVLNAYKESDAIAVEFDLIEFTKDLSNQIELLSKFVYTDEKTIQDDIDEETYEKSVEILKEAGLYNMMMDNYKPIMWQSLLENAAMASSNLDEQYGVDNHFLKTAKEDDKKIIELESAQAQYDILLGFKDDVQVQLLKSSLNSYEESVNDLKKLYDFYKKGDKEELEGLLFKEDEKEDKYLEEYNKKLITERNEKMAKILNDITKKDETVFCTVGLAHIIGDGGIADILESKGYSIKIIN